MNKLGNLVSTFERVVRRDGLAAGAKVAMSWLVGRFSYSYKDLVQRRRGELSRILDQRYDSTVQHGVFKGMRLAPSHFWGRFNRGSILLGLYEQEVVNSIVRTSSRYRYLVDIGAADGLFAIGMLVSGRFERSYCFEISKDGRATILENATLNGKVNEVEIMGGAASGFWKDIPEDIRDRSVILIDIEGREFELADSEFFKECSNSMVYIELHDWFYDDGDEMTERLVKGANATHSVTELTTTSRDLSRFPDLNAFSDDDRWLMCSEGRARQMKWLRFEPRHDSHSQAH